MSGNWDEAARVPPQQLDADTILRTLLDHEVEFVVIGGLAVAAHGFPRATKDIDIVPASEPENRRRLYGALRLLDAEPLEIADFRADELPVPFTPTGLDEGGNWALRTTAGGSTSSSGCPESSRDTRSSGRRRWTWSCPASAESRSPATTIS